MPDAADSAEVCLRELKVYDQANRANLLDLWMLGIASVLPFAFILHYTAIFVALGIKLCGPLDFGLFALSQVFTSIAKSSARHLSELAKSKAFPLNYDLHDHFFVSSSLREHVTQPVPASLYISP